MRECEGTGERFGWDVAGRRRDGAGARVADARMLTSRVLGEAARSVRAATSADASARTESWTRPLRGALEGAAEEEGKEEERRGRGAPAAAETDRGARCLLPVGVGTRGALTPCPRSSALMTMLTLSERVEGRGLR
jgi:hypothetical protein